MKALISPNEKVRQVTSWTTETVDGITETYPVYTDIPNGCRIAQTSETGFDVASPLYWVDCASDLDETTHYFDMSDNTIKVIINEPQPT